jgi:hypothetical protein
MNAETKKTLYCPVCGYNLAGLPENRCPECGQTFSPAKISFLQSGRPFLGAEKARRVLVVPTLACIIVPLTSCTVGLTPRGLLVIAEFLTPVMVFLAVNYGNRMLEQLRHDLDRPPSRGQARLAWAVMFVWATMLQILLSFAGLVLLSLLVPRME